MVVWKREGKILSASSTKVIRDDRISITGTAMDIARVSSKDSANYTCEINTDTPIEVVVSLNVLGTALSSILAPI